MKRRAYLASTATLVGLAGCLGSDPEEQAIEDIEEHMDVEDWELSDETLSVRYQTSGSIRTDVERVGSSYADAVDDGLDADLEATATGASNTVTWTVDRELADKLLEDDLSTEEFVDRVLE